MTPKTSKEMLQGSFLRFLWYVWTHVLALPEPTRVQYDIARYLVGGPLYRFIQAFRGVGKSFLTTAYVVWRLWNDPNLKVVIVSANENLASENAELIKKIIAHPAGDGLWDELRTRVGQRSSTLSFEVGAAEDTPDKSPSVKVVGIFGQLTGSRSDLLISDDVEVPKNSDTETQRDKLRHLTGEYTDIAKPGTEIIYLGTPQSQESVYRDLPEKGYGVRIWPGRYPTADRLRNYGPYLAPMLQADIEKNPELMKPVGSTLGGAPTDPARFDEVELMKKEAGRGAAGFLLQYMLDTSLSDADKYPLKTRDLIVMDVDPKIAPTRVAWASGPDQVIKDPTLPNVGFDGDRLVRPMYMATEFLPFTGSVLHIDPSGRGKDDTGYIVTKFLNGMVFVRRWGGFVDGFAEETLHALAQIAAEEEVTLVQIEENFGDGMFAKLFEPVLRRYRPVPIEGFKVTGQKEVRMIGAIEPVLRQHRLVIDATVLRADLKNPEAVKRGLYQLTHLTAQRGALKHDDRVDVLAQALAYWSSYLNRDAVQAEQDHIAKLEREFERQFFAGTIVGQTAYSARPQGGLRRATGRPMGSRRRAGF